MTRKPDLMTIRRSGFNDFQRFQIQMSNMG